MDTCLLHDRRWLSRWFPKALDWAKNNQSSFHQLLEKITNALIKYIKMQANCRWTPCKFLIAGTIFVPVTAMGIFPQMDRPDDRSFPGQASLIVYANTSTSGVSNLARTGTTAIGVHHGAEMLEFASNTPCLWFSKEILHPK